MKPQHHNNPGTLRAFIALELPQEIKQAIADYVAPLRALDKDIRWTKTENLHCTLKFLGDTSKVQIESIGSALQKICANCAPIAAEIVDSGVFPNEHRPRVLWIGMKESASKLATLAQQIESACRRLEFEKGDYNFTAHITIGRVKAGKAANVVQAMRESPFSSLQILFQECTLMRSELQGAGSVYTPLQKFSMRAVS